MQQGCPCIPRDDLKEAQKPDTPTHPHVSTGADCGQDPPPSISHSSGALSEQHGWEGEEGIPVAFAAVTTGVDAPPGKTAHPCRLRHHRRLAHRFKGPFVEETEAFLPLVPALATTEPWGTAAGSFPSGEGAGNTALSEGCSNKQEPVISHPSQMLISV